MKTILILSFLFSISAFAERDPRCPEKFMGKEYAGSYQKHEKLWVCDYQGTVSDKECQQEGALQTKGPHGTWCQKFNREDVLLSLARK